MNGSATSQTWAIAAVLVAATCFLTEAFPADNNAVAQHGPGGATALTLEQAIQIALEHNPALQAGSGRIEAARGRAAQAGLWSNPEIEFSAEEWPVRGGRGFSDSKQTVGLAQTLPFPGKKSLDRQMGRADTVLSAWELSWRQTEVVRDVKVAFSRVLTAERLLEVGGELVRVAESSARTARQRAEAGAITHQEQLRAELQYEQTRGDFIERQRQHAAAQQELGTIMGSPDLGESLLSGALNELPDPSFLEEAGESRLSAHPSVLAAQALVDRAELEMRRLRLEPYPDMRVGLAGGRLGDADQTIVELRFSVPLPLVDRGKGRQHEARARLAIARAECVAVQQRLRKEWANARQRYRAASAQATGYRDRILPKAAEALRLVQAGFDEGKFGFIDLLDTQRTAAETQLAYENLLLELGIARAELEALIHPHSVHLSTQPN